MDLMTLTDPELHALGCRFNGGTFGRDAARMTKLQKVAYLRDCSKQAPDGAENGKNRLEAMAISVLNARKSDTNGLSAGRARVPDQDVTTQTLPDGTQVATVPDQGPTQPMTLSADDAPNSLFNGQGDDQDAQGDPTDSDAQGAGGSDDQDRGDQDDSDAQGDDQGDDDDQDDSDDQEPSQGAQRPQNGTSDHLENRVREMIAEAMDQATDDAAESITQAIEDRLGDAVAAIRQEIQTQAPRAVVTTLQVPDLPDIDTTNEHPIFAKALALLSLPKELRHGWGLGLVGPMGSTKTTISKRLFEALNFDDYGAVSCSADMTRGVVDGRILPIGNGVYVPSELVRIAEKSNQNPTKRYGYAVDELDRSAAEVIVALHAPLSNGGMHAEPRSFAGLDVYVPFGDLTFIAQMNTHGTGATTQYASASLQDGALMDRWLMLWTDHPYGLWYSIMGASDLYQEPERWTPVQRTAQELAAEMRAMVQRLHGMAQRVESTGIERTISLRAVLKARACLAAGFTAEDTLDVILAGWDADQRAQVLG